MLEVELKAYVYDMDKVESKLKTFAEFVRLVDKADEYWHGPEWRFVRGTKGFRLRRDNGKAIVTFKHKRNEGGIEINNETEFEVSDPEAFSTLVARIGCEPFYNKQKKGKAFTYEGCTIELITVGNIGNFIEIECLVDEDSDILPQKIAEAQGLIRTILSMVDISSTDIEGRSYSELVLQAKAN